MNKISVIIPVHNASKYLTNCINSFLSNSYDNFELIIVDDNSTDNSVDICKSFNNSKIRIFQNVCNNGVSSARNLGISYATGNIITFCDADDMVSIDYFASIDKNFDENCFIAFNYCHLYFNCKQNISVSLGKNVDVSLINRSFLGGYVWNKIYSTKIIKNNSLFFNDQISYLEDLDFNLRYKQHCRNVKIIDSYLYFYRMNLSSVVNQFNKKSLSVFDAIKNIESYSFLSNEGFKELYVLKFEFYYKFKYLSRVQKKHQEYFNTYYHLKWYFINKKIFIKMFLLKFFPKIYFTLLRKKNKHLTFFN